MHIIRLRRPWCKSIETGGVPQRIDVPEADVEDAPREGLSSYYRRSFNIPSGLQESSRVYLRVDGWQGRLESATLNGSELHVSQSKINTDITNLLQPQNHLMIALRGHADQSARLSGEVTLAIDDEA